jgi:PST family polysaccharide transporter
VTSGGIRNSIATLVAQKSELKERARGLVRHAVVRNALLLYVVQFSGYIIPLITLPYLSHILTTEKFGLVAFGQSFAWYFVILTEYGFNLTATREIAANQQTPEDVSRVFSAVMLAKLFLTIVGFVILVVAVGATPALRPYWLLFLISFAAVIGNLLFPLWLYQGLQKMEHVAIRDFAAKLISIAALFLFVHSDRDYLFAAGAQSGGFLLAGIVGLITVPWKLRVPFHWPGVRAVKDELTRGWPAFVSLAISAFSTVTNQFILGLKGPASEVAYFAASNRIISAMRMMVSPISAAVYPHASQKAADSEAKVILFVRKYAVPLSLPFVAAGLLMLAGAGFIPKFLGAKYEPAVPVIRLMAFGPLQYSLIQAYSTYYMLACGYDKAWMKIILVNVAVNFLLLSVTLAFLRGSIALAVTGLVTDTVATLLYWRFFVRKAKVVLAQKPPSEESLSLA